MESLATDLMMKKTLLYGRKRHTPKKTLRSSKINKEKYVNTMQELEIASVIATVKAVWIDAVIHGKKEVAVAAETKLLEYLAKL
jgi:hypothetical protein